MSSYSPTGLEAPSRRRDDAGAAMAEYALLTVVVALVGLVGVQALGVSVVDLFGPIPGAFP
ncbi:MAG TPA: hypothetical protein VFZ68_04255 [Acidimicrobiales bacterium]